MYIYTWLAPPCGEPKRKSREKGRIESVDSGGWLKISGDCVRIWRKRRRRGALRSAAPQVGAAAPPPFLDDFIFFRLIGRKQGDDDDSSFSSFSNSLISRLFYLAVLLVFSGECVP